MLGFTPLATVPLAVANAGVTIASYVDEAANAAPTIVSSDAVFTPAFVATAAASVSTYPSASTFSALVQNFVAPSDAPASTVNLIGGFSDSAAVAGATEAFAIFAGSANAAANANVNLDAGGIYNTSVVALSVGVDAPISNTVYNSSFNLTAAVDAIPHSRAEMNSTASNMAVASASDSGYIDIYVGLYNLVYAADSTSVDPSIFSGSVQETASAVDQFLAIAVFIATVQGNAVGADTIVARYLWELIDDSQNADWTTIDNAQSGTWTIVGTDNV